jgi:predicted tellurium resistance membrane protein TerC
MDRFPIILWLGAALLGKVGGEMMATDPFVVELFNLPHWTEYASMAFFVLFVCGLSKWILIRQKAKCLPEPGQAGSVAVAVGGTKSDGGN